MTYEELLRKIDQGSLDYAYIFSGQEETLKMDAVLRIKDKIGGRLVFDEKEIFYEDIFCEKKIVILRDISKIGFIKKNSSILPIFFISKMESQKSPIPIVDFPRLYGERLKSWIKERFKEKKRLITDSAIELLIETTGGEISFILKEIEKITLFCQEKELNKNNISPILCKNFNKNIFNLLDAIGERKRCALEICNSLLLEGVSSSFILLMIEKRMREIFSLKDGIKEKGIHPWYYKKLSHNEKFFSNNSAYFIFSKLAETDLKLKSYSQESRPLLLLILIYNIIT